MNTNRESTVLAFLSGNGLNPIPEKKRRESGPLVKEFINEAMQEIVEQDRENEHKSNPSVVEDLKAHQPAARRSARFSD